MSKEWCHICGECAACGNGAKSIAKERDYFEQQMREANLTIALLKLAKDFDTVTRDIFRGEEIVQRFETLVTALELIGLGQSDVTQWYAIARKALVDAGCLKA